MKVNVSFLKNKDGLEKTLKQIDETSADMIHVDVSDGIFTENVSVPFDSLYLFKDLKHKLDVHLMCEDPIPYINEFAKFNTDTITVHVEIEDVYKSLSLIKMKGIKCGLALKTETEVDSLKSYLGILDNVIILSVTPGVGGSELKEENFQKIEELNELRDKYNLNFNITFDGGVNDKTISRLKGVDSVVSGVFVVMSDNMEDRIKYLRQFD